MQIASWLQAAYSESLWRHFFQQKWGTSIFPTHRPPPQQTAANEASRNESLGPGTAAAAAPAAAVGPSQPPGPTAITGVAAASPSDAPTAAGSGHNPASTISTAVGMAAAAVSGVALPGAIAPRSSAAPHGATASVIPPCYDHNMINGHDAAPSQCSEPCSMDTDTEPLLNAAACSSRQDQPHNSLNQCDDASLTRASAHRPATGDFRSPSAVCAPGAAPRTSPCYCGSASSLPAAGGSHQQAGACTDAASGSAAPCSRTAGGSGGAQDQVAKDSLHSADGVPCQQLGSAASGSTVENCVVQRRLAPAAADEVLGDSRTGVAAERPCSSHGPDAVDGSGPPLSTSSSAFNAESAQGMQITSCSVSATAAAAPRSWAEPNGAASSNGMAPEAGCSASGPSTSNVAGASLAAAAPPGARSWRLLFKRQHSYITRRLCPRCGQSDLLPVVYGYPSALLMQGMEEGRLLLVSFQWNEIKFELNFRNVRRCSCRCWSVAASRHSSQKDSFMTALSYGVMLLRMFSGLLLFLGQGTPCQEAVC